MGDLALAAVRIWRWRIRSRWYRLWIRKDEFHPSLDIDPMSLAALSPGDRSEYLRDLARRRQIAHQRRST